MYTYSKKLKKNLSKHYFLVFILIFTPLLIFSGTVIFNSFWTGEAFPSFSNDLKERKEYISVYISLLSLIGAIEAICIIILTYGDWKNQHKKTTLSNDAKICLEELFELSRLDKEVLVFFTNDLNKTEEEKNKCLKRISEIEIQLDKAVNKFIILTSLFGSPNLRNEFVNLYANYKIINSAKTILLTTGMSERDRNFYWELSNTTRNDNAILRRKLKEIIEIK